MYYLNLLNWDQIIHDSKLYYQKYNQIIQQEKIQKKFSYQTKKKLQDVDVLCESNMNFKFILLCGLNWKWEGAAFC